MFYSINELRKDLASVISATGVIDEPMIEKYLTISPTDNKCISFGFQIGRWLNSDIKLAEKIVDRLIQPSYVKSTAIIGKSIVFYIDVGQLNIFDTIIQSDISGFVYGRSAKKNERILVEFSSPNIAKKFHPGHLRTTIIGNFLRNLYEFYGYDVTAINYLGDFGTQFGLVMLAYEKYGNLDELNSDPLQHLYTLYVRINEEIKINPSLRDQAKVLFTNLEDGNDKEVSLWSRFRSVSIRRYKEMYHVMGIHFDIYSGESLFAIRAKSILSDFETYPKLNILLKTDETGAKYFDTPSGKLVVLKEDGSTLYASRDIAAAVCRNTEYTPKASLYVVATQQKLYFQQLFYVLKECFGIYNLEHVEYGMIKGMSTRGGNVVFLEYIIEEAQRAMKQKMETSAKSKSLSEPAEVIRKCANAALFIQDFYSSRLKDSVFDLDKSTNIEGDTGPYMMYTHARLYSIREKNSAIYTKMIKVRKFLLDTGDEELNIRCNALAFLLFQFPFVLHDTFENKDACKLVVYLFKICKQTNSIIKRLYVAGVPEIDAIERLALYESVRIILSASMKILGLSPLEKM